MDFLLSLGEITDPIYEWLLEPKNQPLLVTFAFSCAIIGLSFGTTVYVKSRSYRVLLLPLLLGMAVILEAQFSGSINLYLVNISTELLGALFGLALLNEWIANERWSVGAVSLLVLILPFILQTFVNFSDEFILNLRADLLGALIVFMLFHRVWLVDSPEEERELREEKHIKLQSSLNRTTMRKTRKRIRAQARQRDRWDFDIVIRGATEEDVAAKQKQLKRVARVLHAEEAVFDASNDCFYGFLVCALRPDSTAATEAGVRLRVRGPETMLGPVLQTIHEVFEIEREEQTDADSAAFMIKPPEASFSQLAALVFQRLLAERQTAAARVNGGADFEAGYALAIQEMINAIQPDVRA